MNARTGSGIALITVVLALLPMAGCGPSRLDRQAAFQQADADHDGLLSPEEVRVMTLPAARPVAFSQRDADGDGHLNPEEFGAAHRSGGRLFWVIGLFSAVSFVGSLIAIPLVVARLPVDHFVADHHAADWLSSSIGRRLWLVSKNLLGALLICGGVLMLVLPGQGILTLLLGIALTDVPGKWKLMRNLARRPNVMKALNWMRERAGQPPLHPPRKSPMKPEPPPAPPAASAG